MIRIRYAPGEGCEVSGSPKSLLGIANLVASLRGTVTIAADTTQPSTPYPFLLSSMLVQVDTGPICVVVTDGVLIVTGGPDSLEIFADMFLFEESTPEGYHVHFEYFSGCEHIAPESVPMIVSVCHT